MRLFRNCLARFRARRALLQISDSLLEEMGPLDFAESESGTDSDWWDVAMELSYLESQMAGRGFWSWNSVGRQLRAEALNEVHAVAPRARALGLPQTSATLDEVIRLLSAIDRR
ncbi:hypothetical protein DF223_14140 [Mycetocola zhujimingii]|uniref:Uncharacterized protein n=1 Tax=Mycetocola zhujimingii TaxID=2079792 RepID=A0A2U1TA82_9MICO|nr:hypothetical protein DF223_14140 [Mycetocola zhujimingii]